MAAAQGLRRQLYGTTAPLDPGQADALEYVVARGPCRMGDLARFLRVEPSTATRAIERLEKSGLVLRVADANDARAVQVRATDRGRDQYAEVGRRSAALLDAALVDFPLEDREALAELLDRLVGAIEVLMEDRP